MRTKTLIAIQLITTDEVGLKLEYQIKREFSHKATDFKLFFTAPRARKSLRGIALYIYELLLSFYFVLFRILDKTLREVSVPLRQQIQWLIVLDIRRLPKSFLLAYTTSREVLFYVSPTCRANFAYAEHGSYRRTSSCQKTNKKENGKGCYGCRNRHNRI